MTDSKWSEFSQMPDSELVALIHSAMEEYGRATDLREEGEWLYKKNQAEDELTRRRKPPVPPTPITTFEGSLKRHRMDTLNDIGRAALRFAFPYFQEIPPSEEEERLRKTSEAQTLPEEVDLFTLLPARARRRFCGPSDPPQGRYFTLCRGAKWDDGNTLAQELRAYRDPAISGHVFVGDLAYRDTVKELGGNWSNKHAIGIVITKKERFSKMCGDDRISRALPTASGFLIDLPYDLVETRIPDVVDLRLKETQQWLFEWFSDMWRIDDGRAPFRPEGSNAARFLGMLPTLMSPRLAGDPMTDGIGTCLRAYGVGALIYPSARSDVECVFKGGRLCNFSGWNLVDYPRGAETAVSFYRCEFYRRLPIAQSAPALHWRCPLYKGLYHRVGAPR